MARKKNNGGMLTAGEVARLINAAAPQIRAGQTKPTPQRQRKRGNQSQDDQSTVARVPIAGSAIFRSRIPRLSGLRNGVIVHGTERLDAVLTLAAGVSTFNRTPLIPPFASWLNGVAQNYSKWRWIQLQIYYIPAVPTTSAGSMAFGLEYDDNDPTTGSGVAAVQQLYQAVSGPIWAGYEGASGLNSNDFRVPAGAMCITLDCARLDKPYYRYCDLTQFNAMSLTDRSIYSPANVIWATDGGGAGTAGSLLVKYCIELIEPIPAVLNNST